MLSPDPTHTSLYSPAARKWLHHVCEPTYDLKLRPITPITTIIPSTLSSRPDRSIPHPTRARRWWSRCLAQDAPEMGAALGFIDDYLEESHVVSTHVELLDPCVGNLLAFGKAVDAENKSTRLIDTAVYAMGPIGADLGVGAVVEGPVELEGVKGVKVGVLGIEGGGMMAEFGSKIRQICGTGRGSGESAKASLAVRTAVGTTVFRQTRLQSPLPGHTNRFAAKRLVNIDVNITREPAHAHVEFNPWYERQFAIIDESGKWRVWDIEGRQHRDMRMQTDLMVEEYASGSVAYDDKGTAGGWGRIVWGGDLNSVMACDRKRAGLFDIRASPSTRAEINIPIDPGWILDLQRGSSFDGHGYDAFALTSSALTWVDMRQSGKPLMSIPHQRHHEDLSLSMELFNINDSTINALIHSRLNHLITSYRFSLTDIEQFPTFLGNPYIVPGPTPHDVSTPVSFGLTIIPCRLRQRGEPDEKGEEYLNDENLHFFTGFGVGPKLEITQRVYTNKEGEFRLLMKEGKGKGRMRGAKSTRVVVGEEDEDMNIEMGSLNVMEDDDDAESDTTATALRARGKARRLSEPSKKKHRDWRIDLGALYSHAFIHGSQSLRTTTEDDPENSIPASIEHIKTLLTRRISRGELGVISLLNLRQPQLLYDRLEEFETSLKGLLLTDESLQEYQIKSLIPSSSSDEFFVTHTPPQDPSTTFPAHISIVPLYNTLLRTWVQPLPQNTPGKVRLRRERLCRMMATEIWLASIGVNLEPKPESLPAPTPAPSSQDNDTVAPPEPALEPLQRIRTYANVSTRITLPEGMSSVLSKWDVGEDPWEYEYTPDDGSGIKKKKRHHRRRASVKKGDAAVNKLRGDVENWSLQMSSQPPAITVSSQPAQRQVPAASQGVMVVIGSSQVDAGGVVMSQVERGKHGGRVAGRKKRKTGF